MRICNCNYEIDAQGEKQPQSFTHFKKASCYIFPNFFGDSHNELYILRSEIHSKNQGKDAINFPKRTNIRDSKANVIFLCTLMKNNSSRK